MAFIAIVYAYFKFINYSSSKPENTTITEVPKLEHQPERFYGSSASFSGQFIDSRNNILSSGNALIVGSVEADGKPATGLKLRLGLNGKVMSQWVVTDSNGNYYVSLPSGEYRIDGYELDYDSSYEVLSGLIDSPNNLSSSKSFIIDKEKHGLGIDLSFVKPLKKKPINNTFSLGDEITISWEQYPNASSYDVQIYEKSNVNDFSNVYLFPTGKKTSATSLNINEHTDELKVGFYYRYDIRALDEGGLPISNTHRDFRSYDFKVIENHQ